MAFMDNSASPCQTAQHYCAYQPYWRCVARRSPRLRFAFEVPLSQQIKGLHDDLYDVGFAQSDDVGDGIVALPAWTDTLMVALPARHPLLALKRIPLMNCCATRYAI
jgi:DNA-binding transcriptional LysR family regulator